MPAPLSLEREQLIENLYKQGWSARRIAREYGHGAINVNRILRRRGFDTRPQPDVGRNRQYKVDHGAFLLLNDESAYWIGFLMADGCVHDKSNNLICALQKGDVKHLEKLQFFLKSSYPLRAIARCSTVELRIRSKQICETLASWGVTPRKSLTASTPTQLTASPHYWRGVFDGDGCISVVQQEHRTYYHLDLTGSEEICTQFATFVATLTGKRPTVSPRKRSNAWRTRLTSTPLTRMVLSALYPSNCVALERKYELARSIIGT